MPKLTIEMEGDDARLSPACIRISVDGRLVGIVQKFEARAGALDAHVGVQIIDYASDGKKQGLDVSAHEESLRLLRSVPFLDLDVVDGEDEAAMRAVSDTLPKV